MKADERRRLERVVDFNLRHARTAAKEAARSRAAARNAARKLAIYEWDSVFYADTHPGMAADLQRNVPRVQASLNQHTNAIISLDASTTTLYRKAREAQHQLRPTWRERLTAQARELLWPLEIIQAIHAGRKRHA